VRDRGPGINTKVRQSNCTIKRLIELIQHEKGAPRKREASGGVCGWESMLSNCGPETQAGPGCQGPPCFRRMRRYLFFRFSALLFRCMSIRWARSYV
jgi:hypothetical protein